MSGLIPKPYTFPGGFTNAISFTVGGTAYYIEADNGIVTYLETS